MYYDFLIINLKIDLVIFIIYKGSSKDMKFQDGESNNYNYIL